MHPAAVGASGRVVAPIGLAPMLLPVVESHAPRRRNAADGWDGPMKRRKLPAGIQTFRRIREEDCYYVDKTAYVREMAAEGAHYFLSRPRRFGKSLLVDTLKELFEGNEPLFRGLAVHDRWDWSVRHPVLRFSFAAGRFNRPGLLEANFADQMARLERAAGVVSDHATPEGRFAGLIDALHARTGQRVVILVDEYDRPITGALDDPALAADNRDFLRGAYGVVKDSDALIRFSFFTGVSKFSKVSIFPDLNNLTDITLDRRFAAICGYTEEDLDTVFAPELEGLDRKAIRDWYNGYNWRGEESVYNPYGMLLFFRSREFKPYWFETGTPAFLPGTLIERKVDPAALDNLVVGDADLAAFDVRRVKTEALLFQTGYLTIRGEERDAAGCLYRLGYPNREVRHGLNVSLLETMAPEASIRTACSSLRRLLAGHDFAGVERLFRAFFASVPYQWYAKNDVARYEGYYSAVFYAHLAGAGLDVRAEESTSHGRPDLTVRHDGGVCVFEFKARTGERGAVSTTAARGDARATVRGRRGGAGAALAQAREKRYADKYRHLGQPIHLIGVAFSEADRNIAAFEVESI